MRSLPLLRAAAALSLPGTLFTATAEEVLLPEGAKSSWQYLDTGKAPDKTWNTAAFDASTWRSGPAPLGYGEQGLGTTVSSGPDQRRKSITTWFRRTVEVKDPARFVSLHLKLRRDDGAIIFWNGKEIARSNMPAGPVGPDTPAVEALSDDVEAEAQHFTIAAKDLLTAGANTVAVEIHQCDPRSSDLAFDLEVTGWTDGEKPPADTPATAPSGSRNSPLNRILEGLLKLDPKSPGYARQILAQTQGILRSGAVTDDRLWTLLDRARASAPDEMEVVYTWIRARVDARKDLPIQPVKRPLPSAIPAEFRFIADTPNGARNGRVLPRARLLADVDDLELILENCYAYLERRGGDYRGALDALRASLTEDTSVETFSHRVARVLTVFGDPHSRLQSRAPEAGLPVQFVMDGNRLAALSRDRSSFLGEEHPLVEKINGSPALEWLAAAEAIVPQASPQYRRYMALQQLAGLPTVSRQLRREADSFTLTLTKEDGTDPVEYPVPRSGNRRGSSAFPDSTTALRPDGIGYLRIPEMDSGSRFTDSLNEWMTKFKDTRGLIIDVRGNGGGTQDAIKTLLPWFMKPGSPMKIINVAAYRLPVPLPEPNPSGFLGLHGRGLHPATSKVWTPEQAEQIRTFLKSWEPKWKLPAGKFSDWHVMAVSRETNPDAGYYDKPVIVLQNEECFSATDNFLGALKGHPKITLMGTTSGGGSGRMADYTLPNSRLSLTLCQMASFATTGLTYDGNGVPPDVEAKPILTDYLSGKGDSVLEAAVARLTK